MLEDTVYCRRDTLAVYPNAEICYMTGDMHELNAKRCMMIQEEYADYVIYLSLVLGDLA